MFMAFFDFDPPVFLFICTLFHLLYFDPTQNENENDNEDDEDEGWGGVVRFNRYRHTITKLQMLCMYAALHIGRERGREKERDELRVRWMSLSRYPMCIGEREREIKRIALNSREY